ncbi:MAG: hypothetical protein UT37_C0011G0013 [Parcubacteria group bacterium GW2011_GWA2_39_18]|nr:MAG: hypothetical protein UT37_C0011G0013 [Parcubacteria group bacterium GW2011_GWA2_39_18]
MEISGEMKKTATIIILAVVAIIVGFFIVRENRSAKQSASTANTTNQPTGSQQNWESKTDNQLAATVTITPIDILSQSKEWKFDIVMNTHSIELDQDLTKSAVLVDDQGKEHRPINWEGQIGGHHREGVLIFNKIMPTPKVIELKISGIGNVVRNFVW